jgi:transposase, IS6 family
MRHFEGEVILLCVRWYLRYTLSYRDVEELLRERGISVDYTTVFCWVQRYAPELERRCRPLLKATNDSYRIDETYIKIKKQWHYLYRAVDSKGYTIDFMLSATRDAGAAEHFFRQALQANHTAPPQPCSETSSVFLLRPTGQRYGVLVKIFGLLAEWHEVKPETESTSRSH